MKEIDTKTDLLYRLQALGLYVLILIFKILRLNLSCIFVSFIFMIVGPFTPPSFLALKNIKKTMPELSRIQRIKIIIGMWNNLGRNLAEFIFLHTIKADKIDKYIYLDNHSIELLNEIYNDKLGNILFTAHFGNWEALSLVFRKYDVKLSAIFRSMNNKYADKIVTKYREHKNIQMIPKGKEGVIKIVRSLKEGRKLYMLVDQRLSNGIEVPFLGLPAKTSDATAMFAIKNNYKVYSIVVYRRTMFSTYFDIKVEKFDVIKTGNMQDDIRNTTIKINKEIENWIKLRPEQWFWVHNRWKK